MPIKIDFLSNTSKLERGAENAEKALDDVADSLDDVAHDGDRALGRIERSFRDVAREAADTGRDVGRKMDDGFDKAKRGADEFKDEANSTAREAAASFDGSAESIGDAFQEVAANAFGGFGPAGALAGIAAAAGIGLATQAFTEAEDKRRELEERASDLADAYISAGGKVLDAFSEVERAQEVISDPESKKRVQEYADAIGVDFSVALGAYVGRAEDVATVQRLVNDRLSENSRLAGDNATALDEARAAQSKTYQENQKAIEGGRELIKVTEDAGRQFDVYSDYLKHLADTTSGTTKVVDEFGDTVITLPDGKQIYIDAQTGQATDNVDAIERKVYGLPGGKTMTVYADTSPATRAIDALNGRTVYVRVASDGRRGVPFE